jgi:hypothetical protein
LEALSAQEVAERVMPLLRRAGLASSEEQREQHEENLPLALVELVLDWQTDPTPDGRTVAFDEYLAARLAPRLRRILQRQRPDLYDRHRRYEPGGFERPDQEAVEAEAASPLQEGADDEATPEEQPTAARLSCKLSWRPCSTARTQARARMPPPFLQPSCG